MSLDYLKEESSVDPEIKEKVKKILDKGPKNSEDGKFIAQHCNLKIFEEINLYNDKFEFVKVIFDHFLEISEKTDLQNNIFFYFFSSSYPYEDLIDNYEKDFVENFSKNIDYIVCSLNIQNDEKYNIINNIFDSVALDYDYGIFLFLDNFLNLCNKYEFSQEDIKKLCETYMKEIIDMFNNLLYDHDMVIQREDLKSLENMIKICKKNNIPREIFIDVDDNRPLLEYFLETRSSDIYNDDKGSEITNE